MATDQSNEQMNVLVEGLGEVVNWAEDPGALRCWVIRCPDVVKVITEFEDDSERDTCTDGATCSLHRWGCV